VNETLERLLDELKLTSIMNTLNHMSHDHSKKMHGECVELLVQLYGVSIATMQAPIGSNDSKDPQNRFRDKFALESMMRTLNDMEHPKAEEMYDECIMMLYCKKMHSRNRK
jgi:hypothetical protein